MWRVFTLSLCLHVPPPMSSFDRPGANFQRALNTQSNILARPLKLARHRTGKVFRRSRRRASGQFLIIAGALTGIIAGMAAILLKATVHLLHGLMITSISVVGNAVLLLAPAAGLLLTALATKHLFSHERGEGITGVLPGHGRIQRSKTFSYLLRSALTVGCGGSLGLETPITVTGAALGDNLGSLFRLSPRRHELLLASGAAAGIAAIFNAPVAGAMFALEALLTGATAADFIPVLLAAVCGALCSHLVLSEDTLFCFRFRQHFDSGNIPYYLILGMFCGLLSRYFLFAVRNIRALFSRHLPPLPRALLGGLLLGGLCLLLPSLAGEGYGSITALATGLPRETVPILLLAGILKPLASALTHAAGGIGGSFAPSLFTGAFTGAAFAQAAGTLFHISLPVSNFTIVGMAGVLSGVMHAPLTAIFLIAEITGSYELMIPLMIVSAIAFLTARHANG